MNTYCYQKIYTMNAHGAMVLSNPEPVAEFVEKKVLLLVNARSHAEKANVLRVLLQQFDEIYKYDIDHAVTPEPFGVFQDEKEKQRFIRRGLLFEDMTGYLGDILCSYHLNLVQNGRMIPKVEAKQLTLDYGEWYLYAVNDYFMNLVGVPQQRFTLISGNRLAEAESVTRGRIQYPAEPEKWQPGRYRHAYGAMFVLPALLDHFLLMYLQNRILRRGMRVLEERKAAGTLTLEKDEEKLYQRFQDSFKRGRGMFPGTMMQTMEQVYQIFTRYHILQLTGDEKEMLIGGRGSVENTIGTLLHSGFAKQEIRPEYYQLLDDLFGTGNLNIRNHTMHGNSTVYDYTLIGFSAMMLQLLWAIAQGDLFVE